MSATIFHVDNYNPKTNFCDYFPEPIRLVTWLKGLELRGHFTFITPADFVVMLNSPFSGIKYGLHTPYFAMYEKNRNIVNGKLTNKCFESGKSGLICAYKEASFLFENKEILYKRILCADEKIETIASELEQVQTEFRKKKETAKSLIKIQSYSSKRVYEFYECGENGN